VRKGKLPRAFKSTREGQKYYEYQQKHAARANELRKYREERLKQMKRAIEPALWVPGGILQRKLAKQRSQIDDIIPAHIATSKRTSQTVADIVTIDSLTYNDMELLASEIGSMMVAHEHVDSWSIEDLLSWLNARNVHVTEDLLREYLDKIDRGACAPEHMPRILYDVSEFRIHRDD
jgi:nucleoside phosphorylase